MLKRAWILSIMFLLACNHQAVADDSAAGGWIMDRQNGLGHEIIYIDKTAARIVYPEVGFNIMASAPSWNIIWYNTKAHKQYSETLAQYRLRRGWSAVPDPPPPYVMKPTVYAGIKSREFKVKEEKTRKFDNVLSFSDFAGTKRKVLQTIYYISDKVDLPPREVDFVSAYFGMPSYGGIPLASYQELDNGEQKRLWYTVSVQRKAIPQGTFTTPKGYAAVSDTSSLADTAVTKRLNDLMDDMKVGDVLGK